MTRWTLWARPRKAVAFLLTVELLTVAGAVWASLNQSITRRELIIFGAIVTIAVVTAEVGRRVERMRRRLAETPHINLTSVWTVPTALLTTPSLMVATAMILYGHLWLRSWYRINAARPYRLMFSGTTVVISCLAARAVADLAPAEGPLADVNVTGLLWLLLVIVTYTVVNSVLIAAALALDEDDRSLTRLVGTWQDNNVEFATLCIGALTAVLMAWRPWLVALVLLPLYVLHRSVLVRQLEHAATTDGKTGLLNATSWQALATNELARAKRHGTALCVLMVDLDHFKWVNERYGHQAGDQVLRAVADTMREVVRDYDLCGRFGGEEFVILMPETDLTRGTELAGRICAQIRNLPIAETTDGAPFDGLALSASIGVAAYPDAGEDLEEIMLAADNAMFAAKDAGRDQVRAVMPSRAPERRSPSAAE
ncbi:MAG TPA: GGDEF domain-containing protein [Actinophytocola sp.]|uniref:GGDEF domain-containing protein n=1 Tax=Actinophytocola sp. TaxID=1872138 RepID=UPI002DBE8775|nr:GGDEF domain-containing protein [Actinophytocola sp.]HEU5474878.1 GGDEF domain-containing protein [Actinophytocola sp.]